MNDFEQKPFFSVVIVVTDKTIHLLPFTLDSIVSQEFPQFEIIVVDGQAKEHNLELFNAYAPRISKICSASDNNLCSMMNKGLSLAQGEYVHFLISGEFYLSRHAMSFVLSFIETHSFPDLIYTGRMIRHSLSLPQVHLKEISRKSLKGESLPPSLQSYWFSKEALVSIGPFNPRYAVQGGFDAICRFYLSSSLRKAFLKRILTDYEYRRPPPKKILRQFGETLVIIFKHFGPSKTLLWWLTQNHLRLLKWALKCIQGAFWKKSSSF